MTVFHPPSVLSIFFALSSSCESDRATWPLTSALPLLRFAGSLNQTAMNVMKKVNSCLFQSAQMLKYLFKMSRKLQ